MKTYAYDVEIFRNFFSVVFIDVDTPMKYIKAYEEADIIKDTEAKTYILNNLIKPFVFLIYEGRNDLKLLSDFMTNYKTLVGYNSIGYDDNIINYLIKADAKNEFNIKGISRIDGSNINDALYDLSQEVIGYGRGWQYNNNNYQYKNYASIDMQKLLYLDRSFVSLKQVAVQLKHYRLQDLPLHYTSRVTDSNIFDVIDYNINDVIITYKLYHEKIEEVRLRESISKIYGVNVRTDSRSGTGNKLMTNFYSRDSGLEVKDFKDLRTIRRVIKFADIISYKIRFNSDTFRQLYNEIINGRLLIGAETLNKSVIFNNKQFTIATGGLHSVDKPNVYTSTKDYTYIDCDVQSFYPRIILNEEASPEHLDKDIYLSIVRQIVEDRVEAKNSASKLSKVKDRTEEVEHYQNVFKIKGEALKITINSVYGKTGEENSFLYDLKAMYKVTMNGQLYLLMLIEMLADINIPCVSANTDGIICKVPNNRIEAYYKVCRQWESLTNFVLEYTKYEKYICYAVNDYIAIKQGYSDTDKTPSDKRKYIKEKGTFVTSTEIDKGYRNPVVAKALLHYYADGVDPVEFIKSHRDIYDFCISVKTGSDFIKEYHTIKDGKSHIEELQKNVRYYISNVNGVIMKRYTTPKIDAKGVRREYIQLHKGVNSTIFNDFIKHDEFNKYKINYSYYIKETYAIINAISNVVYKKMRTQSYGGLFKDLED
jgi:hypothetical protein